MALIPLKITAKVFDPICSQLQPHSITFPLQTTHDSLQL